MLHKFALTATPTSKMANHLKESPQKPLMKDKYMTEAVKILLDLSNKMTSNNPARTVYRESYRAAHNALLHGLRLEELDGIVAWLWKQGIPRASRILVLGTLGHANPSRMTNRQIGKAVGKLWQSNLAPGVREEIAKICLMSMMQQQFINRDLCKYHCYGLKLSAH